MEIRGVGRYRRYEDPHFGSEWNTETDASGNYMNYFEHEADEIFKTCKDLKTLAEKIKSHQREIRRKQKKIDKGKRSKFIDDVKDKYKTDLADLNRRAEDLSKLLLGRSKLRTQSLTDRSSPAKRNEPCQRCREYDGLKRKYREQENTIQAYQEELDRLHDEPKRRDESEGRSKESKAISSELERVKRKLDEETKAKEDALRRLSEMASSNLRDNNPAITDLSDTNRPTKLAEKMSELYDNEWTDAFEEIQEQPNLPLKSDEECIGTLLKMIQYIYNECNYMAKEQVDQMENIFLHPTMVTKNRGKLAFADKDIKRQNSTNPAKDIRRKTTEMRKTFATILTSNIQKDLEPDLCKKYGIQTESIKGYFNKCIELCWLMVVQDPPLHLQFLASSGDRFDTNAFRQYTTSGPYIEYVVWPALYLNQGGPILAKGVAQGKNIDGQHRLRRERNYVDGTKHIRSIQQQLQPERTSASYLSHGIQFKQPDQSNYYRDAQGQQDYNRYKNRAGDNRYMQPEQNDYGPPVPTRHDSSVFPEQQRNRTNYSQYTNHDRTNQSPTAAYGREMPAEATVQTRPYNQQQAPQQRQYHRPSQQEYRQNYARSNAQYNPGDYISRPGTGYVARPMSGRYDNVPLTTMSDQETTI